MRHQLWDPLPWANLGGTWYGHAQMLAKLRRIESRGRPLSAELQQAFGMQQCVQQNQHCVPGKHGDMSLRIVKYDTNRVHIARIFRPVL